jgi:hypothetical protein
MTTEKVIDHAPVALCRCGNEVFNFPPHLVGVVDVVCAKCRDHSEYSREELRAAEVPRDARTKPRKPKEEPYAFFGRGIEI